MSAIDPFAIGSSSEAEVLIRAGQHQVDSIDEHDILLVNGRTAADLAIVPAQTQSQMATTTITTTRSSSATSSRSSSHNRPSFRRQGPSYRSSGWYNSENNVTLDEIARNLDTRIKRFELWQGQCAKSIVMALFRPTPVVLLVLHPIFLLILALILAAGFLARLGAS